jgi:hypothetical protein
MEPSFYAGLNGVRNRLASLEEQAPIPPPPADHGASSRPENTQTRQHDTGWTVDNPTVWRGGLDNAPENLRDPRMSVGWRALSTAGRARQDYAVATGGLMNSIADCRAKAVRVEDERALANVRDSRVGVGRGVPSRVQQDNCMAAVGLMNSIEGVVQVHLEPERGMEVEGEGDDEA